MLGYEPKFSFRLQQTIRGYLIFAVFRRSTTARATSGSTHTDHDLVPLNSVCSMRRKCSRFWGSPLMRCSNVNC
jgi:hypothetical protein